jgi:hypothetical protein
MAGLADRLRPLVESGQVPGLVAMVGRGDDLGVVVLGSQSVGGRPMDADSLFRIASLTKAMTAAVALVNQVRAHNRPGADIGELEQQRQASKVTEWIDRTTGMHKTLLELDPVRAASLKLAVNAHLTRLRQQPGNKDRPFDELRVEAFLAAITNPPGEPGHAPPRVPEVIVLIDWDTLRDGVRAAGGTCELSDGTHSP